jgi:hypothetical protein
MSINNTARASAVALSFAAALAATAGPASAASSDTFARFVSSSCAGSNPICEVVVIQALGAGKRLDVENVACLIRTEGDAQIEEMSALGATNFDIFVPTRTSNGPGVLTNFAFNTQTVNVVRAGKGLVMHVRATADVQFLGCKVGGTLVTL